MGAKNDLFHEVTNLTLSKDEQARVQCQLARRLEEQGDYEAARKTLGTIWERVGERPRLEGLDSLTKGIVLLRVGVLTGWIGSAKQIGGAQETAKNLITESIAVFETLQENTRVAEAQIDLTYCYWREGAFDEGRVMLHEARNRLTENDTELRATAMLRSAIIEDEDNRHYEALRIHTEAAHVFEKLENHALKGKFHNEFATVLKNLGAEENRTDYIDRALIEYSASSYHFGEAGHLRYQACVENNLGMLFWKAGRYCDAHDHLDQAQTLFTKLKDEVHLAQVDETRARVMLTEGRLMEAERASGRAVRTLEKGDEQSLLAESLTTHGIALGRLRRPVSARSNFERAIDIAQRAGDLHCAGLAALSLIEELWELLSDEDLCAVVERAHKLFEGTRDVSALKRLCACFSRALSRLQTFPEQPDWTSFSLKDAVNRYEAHFIEMALRDSQGKVTQAAGLLGLQSHQALVFMLESRHKHLLDARTPIARRRRSLIAQRDAASLSRKRAATKMHKVKILHVEDNLAVGEMMKDTLSLEGWEVETCLDGAAALSLIASDEPYDLLLLDYDLPGADGLQLVRHARALAHRQATPIIMFSARFNKTVALQAGVNALLRKPQDLPVVVETIASLLPSARKNE
jgi:CheY-like chemotaxis protein/tetratricopeptide (TPR) repeat protein